MWKKCHFTIGTFEFFIIVEFSKKISGSVPISNFRHLKMIIFIIWKTLYLLQIVLKIKISFRLKKSIQMVKIKHLVIVLFFYHTATVMYNIILCYEFMLVKLWRLTHVIGVVQVWYRIGGNKIEENFDLSLVRDPRMLTWVCLFRVGIMGKWVCNGVVPWIYVWR